MKFCLKATFLAVVAVGIICTVAKAADEIKSGPQVGAHAYNDGGPFQVRAITGEHRNGDEKEELCFF